MAKRKIYADNAATTQMSQAAIDTMVRYLATDYGNASQPYSFSRSAKDALKQARIIIADCIGAKPEEIYFTSGGSESDNWAIYNAIEQERNILTSSIEHHAILNPCKYAESKGKVVKYLPVYENGLICPSDIENALTSHSFLSIMMANNELGTIEPIRQYGLMSNLRNAIYHTDAVQAMGHIQIDVKDLGVDMLSASGHKFNGPKGVGFQDIHPGPYIGLMDGPDLLRMEQVPGFRQFSRLQAGFLEHGPHGSVKEQPSGMQSFCKIHDSS